MSKTDNARMNHAGMVGLLCECSLKLYNDDDSEELRDNIEQAISDWCGITGWTYQRTLNRIEVFPPKAKP